VRVASLGVRPAALVVSLLFRVPAP